VFKKEGYKQKGECSFRHFINTFGLVTKGFSGKDIIKYNPVAETPAEYYGIAFNGKNI
jgi:hypothetical protein